MGQFDSSDSSSQSQSSPSSSSSSCLVVREIVLRNLRQAMIDTALNIQLPPPELVPDVRFWYDEVDCRMIICGGNFVPLDYSSGRFILLQHTTLRVADVVQPSALQSLSAFGTSVTVAPPRDAPGVLAFPSLENIQLHASCLFMGATLGTVSAKLSTGSQFLFGNSASVNNLQAQFLDSNPGNIIKARYHSRVTDESAAGCRGTLSVERIGSPMFLSLQPVTTNNECLWETIRPATLYAGQGNACCICQVYKAEFSFTSCRCASICSKCADPSLENNLIRSRKCPLCRAQGRPTTSPPPSSPVSQQGVITVHTNNVPSPQQPLPSPPPPTPQVLC